MPEPRGHRFGARSAPRSAAISSEGIYAHAGNDPPHPACLKWPDNQDARLGTSFWRGEVLEVWNEHIRPSGERGSLRARIRAGAKHPTSPQSWGPAW